MNGVAAIAKGMATTLKVLFRKPVTDRLSRT